MPEYLTRFLAGIYINFNIESLRALEAITQAALLHAALRKRSQMMISDIMAVLPLALYHRVNPATLTEIMNAVNNRMSGSEKAAFASAPNVSKGGSSRFAQFFNRTSEKKAGDNGVNKDELADSEESPPQKARYLRDMLENGVIKREHDLS